MLEIFSNILKKHYSSFGGWEEEKGEKAGLASKVWSAAG